MKIRGCWGLAPVATALALVSGLYALWAQSTPGQVYPHLTGENRLAFTRRIQPILFNCCGSLACHGRPDAPGLVLKVPAQLGQLTPLMTEHNLEQALSLTNLDKPQESLLLRQALRAHGGSSRAPLPSRLAPAYRVLEDWVFAVAGRQPPQALPSQDSVKAPTPADQAALHFQDAPSPGTAGNDGAAHVSSLPCVGPVLPPSGNVSDAAGVFGHKPTLAGEKTFFSRGTPASPGLAGRGSDKPGRNIGLAGSVLPGPIVSSSPTAPAGTSFTSSNGLLGATVPGNVPTGATNLPTTVAPPIPAYIPAGMKPSATRAPNSALQAASLITPTHVPADSASPLPAPSPIYTSSSAVRADLSTIPQLPARSVLPAPNIGSVQATKPSTSPVENTDPFDPALFNRAVHPR